MKVLHLYKASLLKSSGGVQKFIQEIADGSSDSVDHSMIDISDIPKVEKKKSGNLNIFRIPQLFSIYGMGFSLRHLFMIKKIIKQSQVIHLHYPYPFGDLFFLLFGKNKPLVVTYHSSIVRQRFTAYLYQILRYKTLSMAKKIIFTSPQYAYQTDFRKLNILDKTEIIPLGISDRSSESRAKVRFSRKITNYVLFLGAPRSYKGIQVMIDAFSVGETQLIIAGDMIEGSAFHLLRRISHPNITLVDKPSEHQKDFLIENSTCVILPSTEKSEAFGIALLEGAMFGKPLVSTELGTGTSFVNLNGITGIVVPPNDPLALRAAVENIVSSPHVAAYYGNNARARYEQLFQASSMNGKYEEVYRSVL